VRVIFGKNPDKKIWPKHPKYILEKIEFGIDPPEDLENAGAARQRC
jgi:hypothetical protein